MEHLGAYLFKHGIKPSAPRLRIYEYLYRNQNHPTVDVIYHALSPAMPTLSKTTVYNTLKLFVSKGVAYVVNIEDNEARYDANTSLHGHFKCLACGMVFDIPLDKAQTSIRIPDQFEAIEYHINIKGYCQVCRPSLNQNA